jgi:hypothetical protein
LSREIPFKNVDCAVYVGVDHGPALIANIEAPMYTIGLLLYSAHTAGLARLVLGFFVNTDSFDSGLIREHLDDFLEWPFVELLVTVVSPVFTGPDVLKVTHDDRGYPASVCIADKSFG